MYQRCSGRRCQAWCHLSKVMLSSPAGKSDFDFVLSCPLTMIRKSERDDWEACWEEQKLSIRYVKGMWTSHLANLS